MRTYDFAPLWRSTVGFDRLFDLAQAAAQHAGEDNYPPYNIERLGEDSYQISLAVAGFSPDEISITAEQNVVTIEGTSLKRPSASSCTAVSRPGTSSGSSTWPTTSRSRTHLSTMGCCRSNWFERFPRP